MQKKSAMTLEWITSKFINNVYLLMHNCTNEIHIIITITEIRLRSEISPGYQV